MRIEKSRLVLIVGLLAASTFSGCGKKEKGEAEVVRSLEETFALSSGAEAGSAPGDFPSSDWPASSTSSPSAPDGSSAPQTTGATGDSSTSQPASTAASSSSATISPAIQNVAQDVVGMISSRQFASAVGRLDELMRSPDLTPEQRRVTRDAMAEVQRMLITDTSISDAERRQAEDALRRD